MVISDKIQAQLQGMKPRPASPGPVGADIQDVFQSLQGGNGKLSDAQAALEKLALREDNAGRLATMALKACNDDDSTLGSIPNFQEAQRAVFEAALAQITGGSQGSLVAMAAGAGLAALEKADKSGNPLGGSLAAEPFLIGIAEDEENETAQSVCDFLQEEMPALMGSPAREAYRSVLSSLVQHPDGSADTMLAAAGSAALHAVPGQESEMASMVSPFFEQIAESESPAIKSYAEEVGSLGESYRKDDEKKKLVAPLFSEALKTLQGMNPELSLQGETQSTASAVESLKSLPISAQERNELGSTLIEQANDEIGSPLLEAVTPWVESMPEDSPARLAVYQAATRALAQKPELGPLALPQLALDAAADSPDAQAILSGFAGYVAEEMDDSWEELAALEPSPENLATLRAKIAELGETLAQMPKSDM